MNPDLRARLWAWLPARATRSRVTLPGVAAAALGVDERDVTAALHAMERAGHVVRDRATGLRGGWHRGTPIPHPAPAPPEEPTLWP